MVTMPLSEAAATWLSEGEQGLSSQAIFHRTVLGRTRPDGRWNYPHDPSDFRRCELLLRQVPECRDRLSDMAHAGKVWAALVARWPEIVACLEAEVPHVWIPTTRGRAPRTYAFMRGIIDAAESAASAGGAEGGM